MDIISRICKNRGFVVVMSEAKFHFKRSAGHPTLLLCSRHVLRSLGKIKKKFILMTFKKMGIPALSVFAWDFFSKTRKRKVYPRVLTIFEGVLVERMFENSSLPTIRYDFISPMAFFSFRGVLF